VEIFLKIPLDGGNRNVTLFAVNVSKTARLTCLTLLLACPAFAADEPLSLDTRWLGVHGIRQELPKNSTGILVKTNKGELLLPIARDTYWRKGSDAAQGRSTVLVIRDGGQAVAVARADLAELPADADILEASLQFKAQYVERKDGRATINCLRVLQPWAEDARDGALSAGAGYENEPFATANIAHVAQGGIISIPGFAPAVRAWRDGTWANHGFIVNLGGGALQINFPSRESYAAAPAYLLGGEKDSALLLTPNVPLLAQLALKPADLLAARPVVWLPANQQKLPADGIAKLNVFEVPLTEDGDAIADGPRQLLASVPAAELLGKDERVTLPDLAAAAQGWLRAPAKRGILLTVSGSARLTVANSAIKRPQLQCAFPAYTPAALFPPAIRPKAGVYNTVKDGHFYYDGQRLRLWGVVGSPETRRLANLGFNAERLWKPQWQMLYTKSSAKHGELAPFVTDPAAVIDQADFIHVPGGKGTVPEKLAAAEKHIAELKEAGLFIMFAALCDSIDPKLLTDDDSFVAGGADWPAWQNAVKSLTTARQPNIYLYVDQRLQDIKKRHAKNLLTRVNPYTGKAYGEEEAVAIYEVFNENGFVFGVLTRQYKGFAISEWPEFFRQELTAQWNAWLKKKYPTDAALLRAWGELKPGESLSAATIAPAPDLPQRADYPAARAADFIRFLIETADRFHQDFLTHCRALFPKNIGVNLVPFSFDTQYRANPAWTYLQSRGEVNSFGMYFWEIPSQLTAPPGGKSTLVIDSATVADRPSVLYETNQGRPSPYRAEYPLRLAALAGWQDWDGIFWHYWGSDGKSAAADLGYLTAPMMPPNNPFYWTGVHHETDPVMDSAMLLAGRIFLHGLLTPAPRPVTVEIGARALYSYDHFLGVNLAQPTIQHGARLRFTPGADTAVTPATIPGPVTEAIASGPEIIWDWPNQRLILDAPAVKAYIGKAPAGHHAFTFTGGLTLGDINTPWLALAIVSDDAQPLPASRRVLLNAVFDAANTGFAYNPNAKGGPIEIAKAISEKGHEPVLLTPVNYTVIFPEKLTGTAKTYDFALRETAAAALDGAKFTATGGTPLLRVLDLTARAATTPAAPAPTPNVTQTRTAPAATATAAADSDAFLPEIPWPAGYRDAHAAWRDGPFTFTNITPLDPAPAARKSITITGIQLPSLWNLLANLTLEFTDDTLAAVEITFAQPPALAEVQKNFTKHLGEPAEVKIGAQFETSRLRWARPTPPRAVLVTEEQGTMRILLTP
jgi:hypothetical protein